MAIKTWLKCLNMSLSKRTTVWDGVGVGVGGVDESEISVMGTVFP